MKRVVVHSGCQLPFVGCPGTFGIIGILSQKLSQAFLDRKLKKGDTQCLLAPKAFSLIFLLFLCTLLLHLLFFCDATCLPFSASLVLPSLLCFLYHVLFMHHSSYCLAELQPLLCPFILSLLSQSQFSSCTPTNVVFLIVLTASKLMFPVLSS